ncbi:hypothetical protein SARC_01902 [Sphaeroforma arctica JP610]|uniref:Retinoblastoma-associated protein A-box domain-containing protein n=1 Tax=Sphaeroforma arctica JP610 TaxID=667725 RepID=A0A0L0GAN0_9EUKA|nr:hypothetical protein SARC_01902 [Sphaeroforma arctica JP610]KNC85956.1 hypothetical protein SARC_01902 [Sphaeroforma arctica JP610]|eukprot:XP_014159858.1 hypothetical protein SARC_01902 [Sphaeroforma arctica JP610]
MSVTEVKLPAETEVDQILSALCSKNPLSETLSSSAKEYLTRIQARVSAKESKSNLPALVICALFLAGCTTKEPTPDLGQMLLNRRISLPSFINRLKSLSGDVSVNTDVLDDGLAETVDELDHQFQAVSCIFRKYEALHKKVFTPVASKKSETDTRGPYFIFGWLLYLIAKDHLLQQTYDLVDSIHLLVVVTLFTVRQAPRTALASSMSKVLKEDGKSVDEELLLNMLCEVVNAQPADVTVIQTAFRSYLESLINKAETLTYDAPALAPSARRIRTRSASSYPEDETEASPSTVNLDSTQNMAGTYISQNIEFLKGTYEKNKTSNTRFDERMYLNAKFLDVVAKVDEASSSEALPKAISRTKKGKGQTSTAQSMKIDDKNTTIPGKRKKSHPAIRVIREVNSESIPSSKINSKEVLEEGADRIKRPKIDSDGGLSPDDTEPKTPPRRKTKHLSHRDTPLTFKYDSRDQNSALPMQTPTKTAMNAAAVLKELTADISESTPQFLNVLDIRTGTKNSPRRNNVEVITKRLDTMGKIFTDRYVKERGKESLSIGQAHFDLARKLYVRVLTTMLSEERKRLTPHQYGQFINQEDFHHALIACSLEVVICAYGLKDMSGPWLLKALKICPYDFIKVPESFVRAESRLTRSMLKHLAHIEEQMLASMIWVSGGKIYEELKDKDVPRWVDCAPPSQSRMRAKKTVNKTENTSAGVGNTGAVAAITSTPVSYSQSVSAAPPPGAVVPGIVADASSRTLSPTATETINTLLTVAHTNTGLPPAPAQPQAQTQSVTKVPEAVSTTTLTTTTDTTATDPSRVANKGVQLILRKVYNLMYIRLEELCDALGISQIEIQPRVWRLIEDTLCTHIEIMIDRHLDQILLCALFAVGKTLKIEECAFKKIVACYRKQPDVDNNTFRAALLKDGKKGTIIQFYNEVYCKCMGTSILEVSEQSLESLHAGTATCPLSKRLQALWSSPSTKHPVSNNHRVFVSPMNSGRRLFGEGDGSGNRHIPANAIRGGHPGNSGLKYTLGESPTTVLTEINRAVSGEAQKELSKAPVPVIGGQTQRQIRDLVYRSAQPSTGLANKAPAYSVSTTAATGDPSRTTQVQLAQQTITIQQPTAPAPQQPTTTTTQQPQVSSAAAPAPYSSTSAVSENAPPDKLKLVSNIVRVGTPLEATPSTAEKPL